jgi:hypothetical protein
VFTGFGLGESNVRDHWEDLGVGEKITLGWTLGRYGSRGLTGFSCLRIGPSDGLLWTGWWTCVFHKEISAPWSK